MKLSAENIQQIENSSLPGALALVCELLPGKIVFSSSLGQEDQVITDAIFKNRLPVNIITIDTGRLFNETFELLDKTEARYRNKIQVYFPDAMIAFISNIKIIVNWIINDILWIAESC